MPTPELYFDTIFAFQRSAALKASIDIEVFTAIDEGATSVSAIAARCKASERGVRILCNNLTIAGFLVKRGEEYALTPDSAMFLSKRSPAYLGGTAEFLCAPEVMAHLDRLTSTVRHGATAPDEHLVVEENPVWVTFARAMTPMMMPAAQTIPGILNVAGAGAMKVLDIAAGHGMFGIMIAKANPQARIVGVDWTNVLQVAKENAAAMGVADRYETIPGDAFKVEYGSGYDVALLTNFLHHFDRAACVGLLKKVASALKPGGKVAILEFVPNEDRVSPPMAASFSLTMLAHTPAGDAYTLRDLQEMLSGSGFGQATAHPVVPTPETVVVAAKQA